MQNFTTIPESTVQDARPQAAAFESGHPMRSRDALISCEVTPIKGVALQVMGAIVTVWT